MSESKTPIESLVGPSLLTKVGMKKSTKELLNGKDFVLLYFSASWCLPCRQFSPLLTRFYQTNAKKEKFEVIYVSSDRDIPSFEEYYGKMPWLAIPAKGTADIKNTLAQSLKIQGIPSLVVLDAKTGLFVTDGAREEVTRVADDAAAAAKVLASWREKEAVPLDQAVSTSGGQQNPIMALIFMILKNPIYIFGLLYMYKYAMKRLAEFSKDGDDSPMEPEAPAGQDQEF